MPKLIKLAHANWGRQRLRSALTVSSLTLSVGAVIFVYSLSVAFKSSGSSAVDKAIGGADIWVVPATGVTVDRKRGQIGADGALPAGLRRRVEALPAVDSVAQVTGVAFEAVLYGLVGGVIGCIVGLSIAVLTAVHETGEALNAAAMTISVTTLVSAIAGLGPARRAIRAPAVEALSHAW